MTEPRETRINDAAALSGAGRLIRVGSDFDTAWADTLARITALNDARPWGTDEVGVEFAKNYLPEDVTMGASGVLTGITNLSSVLRELGPQIVYAITGSVDTDDETGRAMRPE